jgi:dTDP-4-dehydrorhamnose reductase/mannose-6-phosphate isomerase-like protein (cupin superfamily)
VILILQGKDGIADGIARGARALGMEAEIAATVDMSSMRAVRAAVAEKKPSAVVMAEGLEDLDLCEADPDRAFLANAEAAIHVAAACLEFEATPILISSAEVFGQRGGPWSEGDEPQPMSTFARSKLRGEEFIRRAAKNALVLRVGPMLSDGLAKERAMLSAERLDEADDEMVSPIAADQVGAAIAALISAKQSGVFHVAPKEAPVTRAELLASIARALGVPQRVGAMSGRLLPRKAPRARAGSLHGDKLARHLGRPLETWRASLDRLALDARKGQDLGAVAQKEQSMGHRQEIRRVDKPWGHELIWAHTDRYVGKILHIKQGERLSLQYHEKKDETIFVLTGKMVFEVGAKDGPREDLVLKAGEGFRVTPFTTHRMIALEDTDVLEASTPELDDVVRLEDKYGRQGTKAP